VPSTENDQERLVGGRYRLSSELGSGAMGTVWSGYDNVLQRRVAVKELKVPPGVPEQEARDLRERIMREARALGGLLAPQRHHGVRRRGRRRAAGRRPRARPRPATSRR
jgi:hypothetical protein